MSFVPSHESVIFVPVILISNRSCLHEFQFSIFVELKCVSMICRGKGFGVCTKSDIVTILSLHFQIPLNVQFWRRVNILYPMFASWRADSSSLKGLPTNRPSQGIFSNLTLAWQYFPCTMGILGWAWHFQIGRWENLLYWMQWIKCLKVWIQTYCVPVKG